MPQQARPNNSPNDNATEPAVQAEPSAFKKLLLSPLFKSVALHTALLSGLLISFNFSAKPLKFVAPEFSASAPKPDIVQATFIDSNVIEQKKREKAQAEAAARKRQQEIKRKEAERQENLRKKRVEEARKKREAEQAKQELDRLEREQQKERAIEQQRKKEAEEKAKQEARQRALEEQLTKQLEEEQAAMSQANQKRIMSEVEKYQAMVQSKVQQYLQTDGGFIGETCLVTIQLAPDGLVLSVNAVSGNTALCRIAEAAVLRAGTLPMSKDPEVSSRFRKFELEVSPQR